MCVHPYSNHTAKEATSRLTDNNNNSFSPKWKSSIHSFSPEKCAISSFYDENQFKIIQHHGGEEKHARADARARSIPVLILIPQAPVLFCMSAPAGTQP